MAFTTDEHAVAYRTAAMDFLAKDSLAYDLGGALRADIEADLSNYKEVKIMRRDYSKAGPLNYDGAYPATDVAAKTSTHELKMDRAFKTTFDKLDVDVDGNKGLLDLGNIIQDVIREKFIPEIDARTNEVIWSAVANGGTIAPAAQTVATIEDTISNYIIELEEKGVSRSDMILFMSPTAHKMLIDSVKQSGSVAFTQDMAVTNANGVTYNLPSYDEVAIRKIPSNRFNTAINYHTKAEYDADKTKNGYSLAGDAIQFVLFPKKVVLPVTRVNDVKISMDSTSNTTNRNNECAINYVFDTIISNPDYHNLFYGSKLVGLRTAAPLVEVQAETNTKASK